MDDVKSILKMSKPELLALLEDVTAENDRLRFHCDQLEAENAQLLQQQQTLQAPYPDAAHKEPQAPSVPAPRPYSAEEDVPYGLPPAEEFPEEEATEQAESDLPLGSFAEAMVAVQDIVTRTQAAADAYLARCKQSAQTDTAALEERLAQAEARCRAAEQKAEAYRKRLQERAAVLQRFMTELAQEQKTEDTP